VPVYGSRPEYARHGVICTADSFPEIAAVAMNMFFLDQSFMADFYTAFFWSFSRFEEILCRPGAAFDILEQTGNRPVPGFCIMSNLHSVL